MRNTHSVNKRREVNTMATCQTCHTQGSNMVTCTKCGNVWCKNCAQRGKGPYPFQRASNVCPYCGTTGTVTLLR